jgi:hypothetical protein
VIGATCLALLAGSLAAVGSVATAGPAQAATIPTNPCVAPPQPAPPVITTPPVLTKVRVSPKVVDVRRRARTIEVTLTITQPAVVTRVNVSVSRVEKPFDTGFGGPAQFVGGTATAGTWRATFKVDPGVRGGRYHVSFVSVRDVDDGYTRYNPRRSPKVSWPAPFLVRSRLDRRAPTVSDFRVSTRSVDTRTSAKAVTIKVTTRDDSSGIGLVRVYAAGVDRGFDLRLTKSPSRKHLWVGTTVIPTWAGTSTWKMTLNVRDRQERLRHFSTSDLARRGWQSTLKVTSLRDTVDPTLSALSLSTTSVDARTGTVRVNVSYRVTDDLSGSSTRTTLDVPFKGTVVVTSVSGPATDRTYQGYIDVPQCGVAVQNTWSIRPWIYDNAGNQHWYTTEEIAALGFDSELSAQQRDGTPPYLFYASVDAGGSVRLDFGEPVLMTAPPASLFRVVVDKVTYTGTWECSNGGGDVVVCDADGADVRFATFTPTTAFVKGDLIEVQAIAREPARIGIYDLDGVPMDRVNLPYLLSVDT